MNLLLTLVALVAGLLCIGLVAGAVVGAVLLARRRE